MKKIIPAFVLASLMPITCFAGGADFVKELGPVSSIGFISLFSMSTLESTNYFSNNTRDDAASYVASNGEISGSNFEGAYKDYTAKNPSITVSKSDFALALISKSTGEI